MTGFLSVVMVQEEKQGKKSVFLYQPKLLNLDDVSEFGEGRQLRDDNMNRDFETVYVTTKDGTSQEFDATFALVEKAVFGLAPVERVDPMASDAVNEPVDALADAGTADASREAEPVTVAAGANTTPVPGGGGRARVGRGQRTT